MSPGEDQLENKMWEGRWEKAFEIFRAKKPDLTPPHTACLFYWRPATTVHLEENWSFLLCIIKMMAGTPFDIRVNLESATSRWFCKIVLICNALFMSSNEVLWMAATDVHMKKNMTIQY